MPTTSTRATTRGRGRPRALNPKKERRTGYFTAAEARMLIAWMRKNGVKIDNEAIRQIVLERLATDGITDPGENSEMGRPLTHPWRQSAPASTTETSDQMAFTA